MILRHKFALVSVSAALVAAAIAVTLAKRPAPEQSASSSAAIGGPFTLVSSSGETVTEGTYRGKWLLIYFGYTFCPDACPTALNNMSAALEKLGSAADTVQPLFITVDPRRDTPQVMAEYLKPFDHRIIGLTGNQAQIDGVATAYDVYVKPQRTEGDDYIVDHTSYFYLMSPEGKFVNVIAGNLPGDRMADKLRNMMGHWGASTRNDSVQYASH